MTNDKEANIAIQESERSGTLVCKAAGLCFGYADKTVISDFSTAIFSCCRLFTI